LLCPAAAIFELAKKIPATAAIDCAPAEPPSHVYLGEKYVNNQTLSDVTFLVEGKEFYAHRIALLASSDIFRQAMLMLTLATRVLKALQAVHLVNLLMLNRCLPWLCLLVFTFMLFKLASSHMLVQYIATNNHPLLLLTQQSWFCRAMFDVPLQGEGGQHHSSPKYQLPCF